MNKTILFLIAVLVISTTLGSATALVIPVDFSTTDNVKLYTKTQNLVLDDSSVIQIVTQKCDEGDTIVNGYLNHSTSETVPKINLNQFSSSAFNVDGTDGWIIDWLPTAPDDEEFDFVIVCGKIVPMMVIGGLHLETDTTSLLLGYSVLNMYWIAPLVIGIGLGLYLVKRKI